MDPTPDPRPVAPPLTPLPWGISAIEGLLPHRAPFLFVDRVVAFEADRRVVGRHTWSLAEARVAGPDGEAAVPAAYLCECMAQIGALLVLARPENRGRLIYFLRIDRARFRVPVRAGDSLEIEAEVVHMRRRIGTLEGVATVEGRRVGEGRMTFALADPGARPET